ncbi:hypothetical protein [Cohnella sp. GCM10027633]|uniref:hypothetical protein n=1 Tax=unclassified Cohnella TaxID=2636738 RepID=UPI00362AAE5D
MQIKKKTDIASVLDSFETIAAWDESGGKHYLVFEDRKRGGQWTLMKYGDRDLYSVHGLGADYHDAEETFFGEQADVVAFLWDNRSVYNAAAKRQSQQEAAASAE